MHSFWWRSEGNFGCRGSWPCSVKLVEREMTFYMASESVWRGFGRWLVWWIVDASESLGWISLGVDRLGGIFLEVGLHAFWNFGL